MQDGLGAVAWEGGTASHRDRTWGWTGWEHRKWTGSEGIGKEETASSFQRLKVEADSGEASGFPACSLGEQRQLDNGEHGCEQELVSEAQRSWRGSGDVETSTAEAHRRGTPEEQRQHGGDPDTESRGAS